MSMSRIWLFCTIVKGEVCSQNKSGIKVHRIFFFKSFLGILIFVQFDSYAGYHYGFNDWWLLYIVIKYNHNIIVIMVIVVIMVIKVTMDTIDTMVTMGYYGYDDGYYSYLVIMMDAIFIISIRIGSMITMVNMFLWFLWS